MLAHIVHSLSTLTLKQTPHLKKPGINTRVSPHVPLQFVGIPAGIAAQAALERALSSVRTNVAFQFANLQFKSKTEVSTGNRSDCQKYKKSVKSLRHF